MTHELALNQHDEEELKKKKSIILKAILQEESDDKDESEPERALLGKKIRRFMRKKKTFPRKKIIDRGEIDKEKEKEPVTCYVCKKLGH